MVETKKVKLETEMEVDVPMDIVVDKQRLKVCRRWYCKGNFEGPLRRGGVI